MSLSKVRKLSDNRRRDSFDDRICDDLSEVILQYLPFEDKFRFECVSKQFKRTVFQRHNELIYDNYRLKCGFNSKNLEVMVKKMPQITCLSKRHHFNDFLLQDLDIEVLLNNFDNLVAIDLDLSLMSKTTQQLLIEKFGSKLVSFNSDSKTMQMIGNSFPNIKELEISYEYFESGQQFPFSARNLKKVSVDMNLNVENKTNNLIDFKRFIENNKTLTHLSGEWHGFLTTEEGLLLSKQISQLNQLISFELMPSLPIQTITKFLEQISRNCHQIKHLNVYIGTYEFNETDVQQLMSVLKKFNRLKRLSIEFQYIPIENIDSVLNDSFRTGFKGLTHLSLYFTPEDRISISIGSLLKDFGYNLPDLRHLGIYCGELIVSNELAVTFNQFSRLEYLTISYTGDQSIGDLIETDVTNNCKNIKTIDISIDEYLPDSDDSDDSD